ncbi:MAG: HAD family phosphatase [Planctomycetaceae bacterium]|jgi:HAD superfamily hydrolase (TIGR01509 family)|nr:HAD family phosphatase [Planctomycetaceae bacterium]
MKFVLADILGSVMLAVAFDMDGLMFDTESVYWKSAAALLGRRGFEYTEELCDAIMGRPPRYCFEFFKSTFSLRESWQELQAESEDLFLEFLGDGFSAMPGLFELLSYLEARNIPKCICTSSSLRVVKAVLSGFDFWERFKFVLTAENVVCGKPAPEIYLTAAAEFGINAADMLVLEDSEAGCLAANAAGAFPVIVLAEHNKNGNFKNAKLIVNALNDKKIKSIFDGDRG